MKANQQNAIAAALPAEPTAIAVPAEALAGEPPSVTEQWRDAIKDVVAKLAEDVIKNIKALRHEIDDLENLVVQNAGLVSGSLNDHAAICSAVQQEIKRLSGLVAEMRKTQINNADEFANRNEH